MVRAAAPPTTAAPGTDPSLPIHASLPVDQVARSYYDRIPRDSWAWIRDMWISDGAEDGFLLVEDDAGYIWRVPFTIDGDDVEFDDPTRVVQEYRDAGDDETGDRDSVAVEAVQAGMSVVRFSAPPADQRPATIYATRRPAPPVQAQAIARHTTATSDGPWDGTANEANLSNDDGEDVFREAYAWQDPDGDPDTKAAYSFIHHEVSEGGAVGAANITACITAIGILNGGRGVDVDAQDWSEDRTSIHTHLAGHLRDADIDPPELQELSAAAQPEPAAVTASATDADDRHVRGEQRDPDDDNDPDHQQERNTTMDREEIIELLGLPEDATDEDIREAIRARNTEGGEGDGGEPTAQDGDGTDAGDGTDEGGDDTDDGEASPAEDGDGEGEGEGAEGTGAETPPSAEGGDGPSAEEGQRVAASGDGPDPEVRRRVLDDLHAAGMEVVDGDRLARLESGIEQYEEDRQERAREERDRILDEAIRAGKFAPSRRDHFIELWSADPEGTRDLVENRLSAGTIPVEERGHGDDGSDSADEAYMEFARGMLPELARSDN